MGRRRRGKLSDRGAPGSEPARDEVARGARALVVHPEIRSRGSGGDTDLRLEEAQGLAQAIGIVVAVALALPVRNVRPATLFGEGQIQRIATACAQDDAELVIVDGALSAVQQRNLEEALKRKVIDRTGLILEIFGERAVTAEGRLQVELAHLDYQAGRLVRSWTHLERQRGGFGFLGGPGETQIEADRRLIRNRMARIRRELDQVRRTRGLHRARRQRAPWPIVALVGYTNAGKSTLFNRLTGAGVMAEDLLFATLDPTMRAIRLPGIDKTILSDTVGFISDLPTQLVAAFRATLEEVTAADCIVHVRDIASEASAAQKQQVELVLTELGVIDHPGSGSDVPIIEAWNKWDLLSGDEQAMRRDLVAIQPKDRVAMPLSAVTGEGVDSLLERIAQALSGETREYRFVLGAGEGQRIAWLRANGEVIGDEPAEEQGEPQRRMTVRLTPRDFGRYEQLGETTTRDNDSV